MRERKLSMLGMFEEIKKLESAGFSSQARMSKKMRSLL